MFTRIDEEGLPCYAETMDEKDLSVYEHYCFQIIEKSIIPKITYTNWVLVR
jgi:hypothetical protein